MCRGYLNCNVFVADAGMACLHTLTMQTASGCSPGGAAAMLMYATVEGPQKKHKLLNC